MYAKVKMNVVLVVGFALMASAFAGGAGECESDTAKCTPKIFLLKLSNGTKIESGTSVEHELRTYSSQLVDKSVRFAIMSSMFNRHDSDRPGFKKLYRKISDKAWEDAIDLIKYQSRRGSFGYLEVPSYTSHKSYTEMLKCNELSSLKFALEYEKNMAGTAHDIHRNVSIAGNARHHTNHTVGTHFYHYDPDTAHYLDEKIIEYQSGVMRDLSGYIHNLNEIAEKTSDKSQGEDLGIHLFDEYLEKTL